MRDLLPSVVPAWPGGNSTAMDRYTRLLGELPSLMAPMSLKTCSPEGRGPLLMFADVVGAGSLLGAPEPDRWAGALRCSASVSTGELHWELAAFEDEELAAFRDGLSPARLVRAPARWGAASARLVDTFQLGDETDRLASEAATLRALRAGQRKASMAAWYLHEGGHRAAADLANGVASNFMLAQSLYSLIECQPTYIRGALSASSGLLELVVSLSRRGLSHVCSLVVLRDRDDRACAFGLERVVLEHHALGEGPGDGVLDVRAPGLEPQPAPDGPARSLPRESRAGPADEDPEHSGSCACCCLSPAPCVSVPAGGILPPLRRPVRPSGANNGSHADG